MTTTYVHPASEVVHCLRGLDPAQVEESAAGTVYLVHLDRPLILGGCVFGHYIGHASQGRLVDRMLRHRSGRGARFLRMALRHGCTWHIARVWPGGYEQERKIKKQGGASRFCPSCGVVPTAERQKFRRPDGRYLKPIREPS